MPKEGQRFRVVDDSISKFGLRDITLRNNTSKRHKIYLSVQIRNFLQLVKIKMEFPLRTQLGGKASQITTEMKLHTRLYFLYYTETKLAMCICCE